MKGFLEEYGLIIVVVAVILLMLLFGKSGYAKGIQDAILGSADHIVETGENITKSDKKEVNVIASDTLDIEGKGYIVLEKQGNGQALVMTIDSIGDRRFHANSSNTLRSDGQYINTYENSEIDNYLENDWYNSLSSTMKSAIQPASIKQASYAIDNNPDSKQETGYEGQVYNTISRHVFLPSISEIGKVVNLRRIFAVQEFLNNTSIWTRDSCYGTIVAECLLGYYGGFSGNYVYNTTGIRPAFVIDLSQVDYKVTGHPDYE